MKIPINDYTKITMIIGDELKKYVDVFSFILKHNDWSPHVSTVPHCITNEIFIMSDYIEPLEFFFCCMFVNFIKISPWNALKCKQMPLDQNNYQSML